MKKLIKLIGIIALIAIIGFSFAACGGGGGGIPPYPGPWQPEPGETPFTPPTTPEAMSNKTALQYFTDNGIKAGWNLGNTLDAVNAPSAAVETAWGNPAATQALFNGIKESGFDIVRIPVTWIGHIGAAPDYTVSEARIKRVAEVIGYAKTAGIKMVIINIHHDGNYTEPANGTWGFVDFKGAVDNAAKKTQVQEEIGKVWTQIAE